MSLPSNAATRMALDALDRTYWCLRSLSSGDPVRDLDETLAEAERVLAIMRTYRSAEPVWEYDDRFGDDSR